MKTKSLDQVHNFWSEKSCGEVYAIGSVASERYKNETHNRYKLEPYIKSFAQFESFRDKDVLEIGVGMGSDHSLIAMSQPTNLWGIDLTQRSIDHTSTRFKILGLKSNLSVGNAEKLSFRNNQFDAIYSWGVLHHSPNTEKAFDEIYRVLKPGGTAKIMIYYKYSPTGFALWLRHGLIKFKSMSFVYSEYLESPGTKAFTVEEAKVLTSKFSNVNFKVQICFGDLLEGEAGQRHKGIFLSIAKKVYPRRIVKFISQLIPFGLFLLITVKK